MLEKITVDITGLPDDSRFGGERTCGLCVRGCEIGEEDYVACTASSEDNPIWAIRKYSMLGMRNALAHRDDGEYLGQDPEKMRRDDGYECPAFIPRAHGEDK